MRASVLVLLTAVLAFHGCGGGGSGGGWSETAPPEGGTVTALTVHPSDDRVRLAGTPAGLFRSVDRGLTWSRVVSVEAGREITCLAFSRADPNRVFAGTRRAGLYRSVDGGASFGLWNGDLPAGRANREVTALATDPDDRDRLYLALAGRGVYRSEDGGVKWVLKVLGLTSTRVQDLAVDRADAKRVFAATDRGVHRSNNRGDAWSAIMVPLDVTSVLVHPTTQGLLLAAGPDGLWRSPDDGRQWIRFETGMRTQPYPGQGTAREVTFDPSNPGDLYASGTEGVWRARRGQNRWDEMNVGLGTTRNRVVGALAVIGQGTLVGPALMAGVPGEGLFASTSGGVSWSRGGAGITAVAIRAIAIAWGALDTLYVGTPGRVWRSPDRGTTWFDATGNLTGTARSIRDLWVDPRDARRVIAATDAGVFLTGNNGGAWRAAAGIGAAHGLAVHADNGKYGLVLAVGPGGVFRSEDGGSTFARTASGSHLVQLTDVAVDPVEASFVYVVRADRGVLVSRNRGATFTGAGQGLPVDLGYETVQIDAGDPARLLVSSRVGGIYRSIDSGVTWAPASAGLPSGAATGALCADPRSDPSHRGRVVAGVSGHGLYRSGDGGVRWAPLKATADREVLSLALAPGGGDWVYAGLTDGLLRGR